MKPHNRRVYLDFAASTPVDPRVEKAMVSYFGKDFGNPSALYVEARTARRAVEYSRTVIAQALNCKPSEILFTGGGTESNNLAIFGSINMCDVRGKHIVTSSIEHPSVLDCCRKLEEEGALVDYVPVTGDGVLDMSLLERALNEKTAFVSVMFANNEIGTLQPIRDVVRAIRKKSPKALLHTDASQAPVFYKLDVQALGVDLLTIDGHKMYGPKGVGVLYKRTGVKLIPMVYGGSQEYGLRSGTENVPCIVGLAKAYEIADSERYDTVKRISKLRDYFFDRVTVLFSQIIINGSTHVRIPNNINISFIGLESEFLVLQLDEAGISCATRSACFGAGGEGSPVVAAINKDGAGSAVRFSLGRGTTKEDIDYVLSVLEKIVHTK